MIVIDSYFHDFPGKSRLKRLVLGLDFLTVMGSQLYTCNFHVLDFLEEEKGSRITQMICEICVKKNFRNPRWASG